MLFIKLEMLKIDDLVNYHNALIVCFFVNKATYDSRFPILDKVKGVQWGLEFVLCYVTPGIPS